MEKYNPLPGLKGKIGLTLGHSAAIGLCLARLYLRVIKDRVWWDDRIALAAAALDMLYMLTLWVEALHPGLKTNNIRYQNAWFLYFPANTVTWLSRVSLWLSLSRIYASPHKTRRLAFILANVFGVVGTLCTISAVFGCRDSNWGTRLRVDRCFSDAHTVSDAPLYTQLSVLCGLVDIVCDMILVLVPTYLLYKMRLKRKTKIVVILLGSGSVIPTAFAFISIIIVLASSSPNSTYEDSDVLFNTLMQTGTILVLISANLLVVGAAIYSRIERRALEGRNSNQPSSPSTSNIELTRISTSRYTNSFKGVDEDADQQEDLNIEETRPLFWSLVDRREREYVDLSVARRITV